jgi:hypothetical protein
VSNDEYKYYLYSPRPDYGVGTPTFIDVLPEGGFVSLYAVTKESAERIRDAGTCKGFRGIVHSSHLWLDIDSYEKADRVEERLKEMGFEYISYDTGGRGAHFGVVRDNSPSHLLPSMDRAWVQQHFPEADSSIYTHLHPFRLPGTPHHRTGKRKQLVSKGIGHSLRLPQYTQEVRGIEVGNSLGIGSGSKSILDQYFIQRNSEPCKAGERHPQLVRLIYALRDSGYSLDVARFWVNEVNKRFQPPKEQHEIEKALGSIYR